MSAREPVAIIGGGIIGLTLGWRLAEAGMRAVVFERGEAGQGASHAAAGMLAPGVETEPGEDPLVALGRESLALWPGFAAELAEKSGIEVGLRTEGTIEIALTRDDAARLARRVAFQRSRGIELQWLSPAEARAREPHLGPQLAGAVFSFLSNSEDIIT
jgi:glycine oxidase